MPDFLQQEVVEAIVAEFPQLKGRATTIHFGNERETKLASTGFGALMPQSAALVAFLNSDVFLKWLQQLTGIKETLISDPYLAGGGYHQIEPGGFLKVHADFNRHPKLDLGRRLNLLLYLNDDWDEAWGGDLQLFDQNMDLKARVMPHKNTCVVFTTRSDTFHGHPDPLKCPAGRTRDSLALYYFSDLTENAELGSRHGTLFKQRNSDSFNEQSQRSLRENLKRSVRMLVPPVIWEAGKLMSRPHR